MLVFFARIDTRVLWIGTIGSLAWYFVGKTSAAASALATVYTLAPLDRPTLESVIVNRHRRSGLPLRFAEPAEVSPLLRQRLRRAKASEERQDLLRADYFERLSKQSGQNLMLAFLYWLHSADFKAEANVLTVKPLQPLNFQSVRPGGALEALRCPGHA